MLSVACVAMPIVSRAADGQLSYVGKGEDKIPVVVVSGTPYEMGKQLGELTKKDAVELVNVFMQCVQAGDPKRYTNKNLDATWNSIAAHTDNRFKERAPRLGPTAPAFRSRRCNAYTHFPRFRIMRAAASPFGDRPRRTGTFIKRETSTGRWS